MTDPVIPESKIREYGLRQLEWDRGGEFADSNRVVDRHNREIILAYEMGLGTAESLVRDLARALQDADETIRRLINGEKPEKIFQLDPESWHQLLSRIPKELK